METIRTTNDGSKIFFTVNGLNMCISISKTYSEPTCAKECYDRALDLSYKNVMLRKRYNNFAACIYEDYEGRKNAYLPGGNKLPRYILFVGADYTWNQYVETIKQRNMLYSVAQKDFFEILQGCCEQGSDPAKYSKMHEEAKKIEEKLASIKSTMEEQINKDKEYLDKVKFEFSRCFNWDIVLAESDYSLVNLCFEIQKNEYLIKYYTQRIKVEIAKLNRMLEEIS